jgi:hypothetical protein
MNTTVKQDLKQLRHTVKLVPTGRKRFSDETKLNSNKKHDKTEMSDFI